MKSHYLKISRPLLHLVSGCSEHPTGYDIESVYVVPSKQKDWGNDHLGKSILDDGKSRFISFNKSGNTCIYDMSISWVGFSSDEDIFWERLNLCEIHKITLHYNSKSKVTSITTD